MPAMTEAKIKVLMSLIRHFQDDGAQWTINGVDLTLLRKELQEELDYLKGFNAPRNRHYDWVY